MTNPMVRTDWYEMVMVQNVHNSYHEGTKLRVTVRRPARLQMIRGTV